MMNFGYILYNIRKILKYGLLAMLTIAFIIVCYLLLFSTSSYCATVVSDGNKFLIDDYVLAQFAQTPYYNNPDYKWLIWSYGSTNAQTTYRIIVTASNTVDYIADYNSSTHAITLNPNITSHWGCDAFTHNMPTLTLYSSLSDGSYNNLTTQYRYYGAEYRVLWCSNNDSLKINGTLSNIDFPISTNLIPCCPRCW